jgi:hypothetical protein
MATIPIAIAEIFEIPTSFCSEARPRAMTSA